MKKKPGDIIVLHLCNTYDNHMMYGAWDMERILGHFLPFYPTNNPKHQNFEKIIQTHGDIIVLHKRTINNNHICMVPEI